MGLIDHCSFPCVAQLNANRSISQRQQIAATRLCSLCRDGTTTTIVATSASTSGVRTVAVCPIPRGRRSSSSVGSDQVARQRGSKVEAGRAVHLPAGRLTATARSRRVMVKVEATGGEQKGDGVAASGESGGGGRGGGGQPQRQQQGGGSDAARGSGANDYDAESWMMDDVSNLSEDVWKSKPAWCQPWTILGTGTSLVGASWLLLHSLVASILLSLLISAWWYTFLIAYPQAYSAMVREAKERRRSQFTRSR